jgi:hypothetical protein
MSAVAVKRCCLTFPVCETKPPQQMNNGFSAVIRVFVRRIYPIAHILLETKQKKKNKYKFAPDFEKKSHQ